MCSLLHHCTIIDYNDFVRAFHSGQSMRHHHDRRPAACYQFIQRRLYNPLILSIQCTRALIQQIYHGGSDEGAGDCDPLFLTP